MVLLVALVTLGRYQGQFVHHVSQASGKDRAIHVHAIKTYGRVSVHQIIPNLVTRWGRWSASRTHRFTPYEKYSGNPEALACWDTGSAISA